MKLFKFFVLAALFCFGVSAFGNEIQKFELEFSGDDFQLQKSGEFSLINVEKDDYFLSDNPGEPAIPYYAANLAVPGNAEFSDLDFKYDLKKIADNVVLKPVQHIVKVSNMSKEHSFVEPDMKIYESNAQFPEKVVEYTASSDMSKYRYFGFKVSPFVYYPESRELYLVTNLRVNVEYEHGKAISSKRWDNGLFGSMLSSMVINPEDVTIDTSVKDPADADIAKYIIITSEELKESFEPLALWKTQQGLKAEIVTTEYIFGNYEGVTDQLKIKNCIKDYYENHGTVFVLLGGDDEVVIDQNSYIVTTLTSGVSEDNTNPCDLFYACFDNQFDWNKDGDENVGEHPDDDVDYSPEVILSRAPVNTVAGAEAFVAKSINYEKNPPATDFVNKMMMMGVTLFDEPAEDPSDAEDKSEKAWSSYMSPYWSTGQRFRFYDTATDYNASGNEAYGAGTASYNVSAANLTDVISKGYNFLHIATHGMQTMMSTEGGGGFSTSNASNLTNSDRQGILVTIACLTNAFDTEGPVVSDPCLSEAFLRNPNGGAVAYYGGTRSNLGYPGHTVFGAGFNFTNRWFRYCFSTVMTENEHLFGAVASSSKASFANYMQYDSKRWVMYIMNQCGDPALSIYTDNPQEINVSSIPASVVTGETTSITIESDLADATICISKNGGKDFYLTGVTDGSGNFTADVNPQCSGDLDVVITKHNYIPAVKTIAVTGGSASPFALNITSIDEAMATDAEKEITINLNNQTDFSYGYDSELILRTGEILRDYDIRTNSGDYKYIYGITSDGSNLWMTSPGKTSTGDQNKLLKFDLEGNLLAEFDQVTSEDVDKYGMKAITSDGQFIYGGDKGGFYKFNPETEQFDKLFEDLPSEMPSLMNLTFIPGKGFCTLKSNEKFIVFDTSGAIVEEYLNPGSVVSAYGLGYDSLNNSLWLLGKYGLPKTTVYEYSIQEQKLTGVSYQVPALEGHGSAQKPAYGMFISQDYEEGYVAACGLALQSTSSIRFFSQIVDERWVRLLSGTSDELASGESQNLVVKLDAYAMTDVMREATIRIFDGFEDIDIPVKMSVGNVGIDDYETVKDKSLVLYQNYPNPFNPVTTIKFYNNKAGDVKLTVFNIKGEEVVKLVNGNIKQGFASVQFNATSFNSGVYYYTLTTGTESVTKKMVLIK